MDSNKKNTKLLPWILAVLLTGIWGEIGYRLFVHSSSGAGTDVDAPATFISQSKLPTKPYTFQKDERDPFAYIKSTTFVKRKPKVIPLIVHIWVSPPLSLEGIIMGDGKKTAILATRTGQTYFLTEGDTLSGVKILRVDNSGVAYRYQKKDTSWTLER